jgi:uncharacterized protein (TIGR00251 family)
MTPLSMPIRAEKANHVTSSGNEGSVGAAALAVNPRAGALLVGVRVIPSAARTEMRGFYGDRLKVAVSAPPEDGKANARLVQALAVWLEMPVDHIRVESGHAGRDKVVGFSGIKEEELRDKLNRLLCRAGR